MDEASALVQRSIVGEKRRAALKDMAETTQELQRVYDSEIVQPGDAYWEESKSQWARGQGVALMGHLLSAKAAASIEPRYGEGSLAAWGKDVGVGRTMVYRYAAMYRNALEEYGSEEELSRRLDGSPLAIWQVIEAMSAPRGERAPLLNRVEDENIPTRKIREIVSADFEEPKGVEHVDETRVCEACSGTGRVPVDK